MLGKKYSATTPQRGSKGEVNDKLCEKAGRMKQA